MTASGICRRSKWLGRRLESFYGRYYLIRLWVSTIQSVCILDGMNKQLAKVSEPYRPIGRQS